MPPQQRQVEDDTSNMRRVSSESDLSEAGEGPRRAQDYRVRKSSLIG